ncbi:unnamed protein product [Sympodiomycopsis kandeliae]
MSSSSSSRSTQQRRVPISIKDGRAYVWSSSDVLYLRSHHRIIGILTGSLPLLPQQNAYLGLPLQLMPEEVLLLTSRNAACLIDDERSHAPPTKEQWKKYVAEAEEDIHNQRIQIHQNTVAQKRAFEDALSKAGGKGSQQSDQAAVEKRRLRKEKAQSLAADNQDQDQEQGTIAKEESVASTSPTTEQVDLSSYAYSHLTHDSSDGLPWYNIDSNSSSTPQYLLDQLTYQTTPSKQEIFTHLNDTGYYLSCGLRFGGDFVVYPGDPFRYHSHFTLTIPKEATATFSVGKLIADGRLGTAVKKVHLIGSQKHNEQQQQQQVVKSDPGLSFYSLTWAGFGT